LILSSDAKAGEGKRERTHVITSLDELLGRKPLKREGSNLQQTTEQEDDWVNV
jgi:hypothetical protein